MSIARFALAITVFMAFHAGAQTSQAPGGAPPETASGSESGIDVPASNEAPVPSASTVCQRILKPLSHSAVMEKQFESTMEVVKWRENALLNPDQCMASCGFEKGSEAEAQLKEVCKKMHECHGTCITGSRCSKAIRQHCVSDCSPFKEFSGEAMRPFVARIYGQIAKDALAKNLAAASRVEMRFGKSFEKGICIGLASEAFYEPTARSFDWRAGSSSCSYKDGPIGLGQVSRTDFRSVFGLSPRTACIDIKLKDLEEQCGEINKSKFRSEVFLEKYGEMTVEDLEKRRFADSELQLRSRYAIMANSAIHGGDGWQKEVALNRNKTKQLAACFKKR